jgi:hypothetical protein
MEEVDLVFAFGRWGDVGRYVIVRSANVTTPNDVVNDALLTAGADCKRRQPITLAENRSHGIEKLIGHVGLTLELSGHINREAIDWSA